MKNKIQCPECSRHFSKHLVKFPMFLDDSDKPKTYMICPICAYERKIKTSNGYNKIFLTRHAEKLYEEAKHELQISNEPKKGPLNKDKIQYVTLERLTSEEKKKIQKALNK